MYHYHGVPKKKTICQNHLSVLLKPYIHMFAGQISLCFLEIPVAWPWAAWAPPCESLFVYHKKK